MDGQSWRIYYRVDCSRLQIDNLSCTLHGLPEKPRVCRRYNAYSCFYKPMFDGPESDRYVRFNRERLEVFASLLQFDGHRNIVHYPSISELRSALPEWKAEEFPPPIVRPLLPRENGGKYLNFKDFFNPCGGCSSWCCTSLSFPYGQIHTVGNLDHLWFCLGFPGVELGITPSGWMVIVHSKCQHFQYACY